MSQFAKKKEGIGLGFNTKTLKQQSSTNFFKKRVKDLLLLDYIYGKRKMKLSWEPKHGTPF